MGIIIPLRMKIIPHLSALCAALVIGFASSASAATVAYSVTGEASITSDPNGEVSLGFFFTMNADRYVSALGMYDAGLDGLAVSHAVGIYSNAGVLLASATVPGGTTGTLVGDHRYISLVSQLFLASGQTYLISAVTAASTDGYQILDGPGLTVDPAITIGQSKYNYTGGNGLGFPTGDTIPGRTHVTPNFLTVIPEPGGAVLLLAGLGLVCVRMRR